jgi:hypothetical protein
VQGAQVTLVLALVVLDVLLMVVSRAVLEVLMG